MAPSLCTAQEREKQATLLQRRFNLFLDSGQELIFVCLALFTKRLSCFLPTVYLVHPGASCILKSLGRGPSVMSSCFASCAQARNEYLQNK
jgi:hypothetical protein